MPLIFLIAIIASLSVINIRNGILESKQEIRDKEFKYIESKITSDLEQSFLESFHHDRLNCLNEISEDMELIFGNEWASFFYDTLPDYKWSYRCNSAFAFIGAWNIAFEVWYSKIGFIPSMRHRYNIAATPLLNEETVDLDLADYDMNVSTSVKASLRELTGRRICEVIERNIKQAHPSLNLRLCNGILDTDEGYLVWEYCYERSGIKPGARPWTN